MLPDFLRTLFLERGVAQSLVVISLTVVLGLRFGEIPFGKIRLGSAGALFVGLLLGAAGLAPDGGTLHFLKEFGLILFVFAIGLQSGPGFFSSLRSEGLVLNGLSLAVAAGNVLMALLCFWLLDVPVEALAGAFSGAVTNTPSLGAAQQVLAEQLSDRSAEVASTAGMAYAVTYPFGILGVILAMAALRRIFRVDPAKAAEEFERSHRAGRREPVACNVELRNAELDGRTYADILGVAGGSIVLSRRLRGGSVESPNLADRARIGDILLAVGDEREIDRLKMLVGGEAKIDIRHLENSPLVSKKIMVTKRGVTRRPLSELNLVGRFHASIVRIYRSGVVFTATPNRSLHVGDTVTVVAPKENFDSVAELLGNAPESLNRPNLLPVFAGIFVGVVAGSFSVSVPGLPAPVKLGLAGGPLLVALCMGWMGKIRSLNFYQTPGANMILREFGLILFLGCVGLASGELLLPAFAGGHGLKWLECGLLITFLPVFAVGFAAMKLGKNYLNVVGLMAGATTNPPALGYANSVAECTAQNIGYAGVYPLAMLMRVLVAQLFVLALL